MAASRKPRKSSAPSNGHAQVPAESAIPLMHKVGRISARLHLSRQAVYNLIERGDLEGYPVAGVVHIPERSVLAYLERCGFRVQP